MIIFFDRWSFFVLRFHEALDAERLGAGSYFHVP